MWLAGEFLRALMCLIWISLVGYDVQGGGVDESVGRDAGFSPGQSRI